jgi:hypothetical protein
MGRRRDRQAMTALGAMEERLVVAEPVITWAPCRDDWSGAGVLLACTVSRLLAGEDTTADDRMRPSLSGAGAAPGVRWGRQGLAGATGRQDPAGSSAVSGAQGPMRRSRHGGRLAPTARALVPPVIRGASR